METKLMELRDKGTCIPLLCIKPNAGYMGFFEKKVLWRYGYKGSHAVILLRYDSPSRGTHNDAFEWGDRTFQTAHQYVEEHWDDLKNGSLIDVRVILGETTKWCQSEFL